MAELLFARTVAHVTVPKLYLPCSSRELYDTTHHTIFLSSFVLLSGKSSVEIA